MFRIVNLDVGPYCDANMLLLKIPALIHIGRDAEVKMAIILPTGQWYAPSAVINDAWYCRVLHCIV